MHELPARQVTLKDSFWSPRCDVNSRGAIFHQWEQLEASGCIDNFRIAAGDKVSFRKGWFFADSDAYKWLEAASRISATYPVLELSALMDGFIDLLARAQTPDGYLFTYNQIHFPGERWVNLQIEHELYCHGHLIEAGVSHFEATAKNSALEVTTKAADLLVRDFLNTGPENTCGHEEIELALLRLYRLTGKEAYLELARQFLERRGKIPLFALHLLKEFRNHNQREAQVERQRQTYLAEHPDQSAFQLPPGNFAKKPPAITLRWYANALSGKYAQQHTPVRKQTIPVGHSVRFGYLETALAMLYHAHPDLTMLLTLEQAWERMTTRRMYVTGGIGSLPALEGFGNDYELDPEYAYTETCAALASLFWNWEMALITRKAQYSDLFEWQLYNAAAVGMGLSGENYLYNNPLTCHAGVTRQAWYAVPCCPSNLSRTLASLGKYIYSFEGHEVWIHQYFGNRTALPTDPTLDVDIETRLPWEGQVKIRLTPADPVEFTIHLRIPSWYAADARASLYCNGEPVEIPITPTSPDATACGYDPRRSQFASINRTWSPGDVVELCFDLPVSLRRAHPRVRGHAGKVALTRGPLVYCLESVDNPDLDIFSACIDASTLRAEFDGDLFNGVWVLCGQTTEGQPLTAIPYQLWANRGPSQMTVWVNINR